MIAEEYYEGMGIVRRRCDVHIGLPQRYTSITRDGRLHDRCAAAVCDYYWYSQTCGSRSVICKVDSM